MSSELRRPFSTSLRNGAETLSISAIRRKVISFSSRLCWRNSPKFCAFMFIPFTFTSHYSRLHHITLWLFIFTLIHFTPYIILSQALFTLKTGEYVYLLAGSLTSCNVIISHFSRFVKGKTKVFARNFRRILPRPRLRKPAKRFIIDCKILFEKGVPA